MIKFFFITAILFFQMDKSFGQDKPRVYLSGIEGNLIKKSQLLDTSIRIITNSENKISGIITIYLSGGGFLNVISISKFIGSSLMINSLNGMKERLITGSSITIDGYRYSDEKTKRKIYFEGSSYTVIDD